MAHELNELSNEYSSFKQALNSIKGSRFLNYPIAW